MPSSTSTGRWLSTCAWRVWSVRYVLPGGARPTHRHTGVGAGPIVVIGTTGDPAIPLSSTELMADALDDGRLVVVEANQHTGYGVNQCINELVNDYLIELMAPADDTMCR